MFKYLWSLLPKNKESQLFITILLGSICLTFLTIDFKLFMLGVSLLSIVIYLITNDALLDLTILLLITAMFQLPGKYYTFEIAPRGAYYYPGLTDGIIEGYGLVASDMVSIALALVLLRRCISSIRKASWSYTLKLTHNNLFKIALVSWLVYFSISFFSSGQYSLYPTFSIVCLIQYTKIIIMFISSYILFSSNKHFKKFIIFTMCAIIFFQAIEGIQQLGLKTPTGGLPSGEVVVAEENLLLPRVQGTFGYPNQFAIIQLTLLFFIIPFALTQKHVVLRLSFVAGLISIILSQSRTSWVILLFAFCIYLSQYKKNVRSIVSNALLARPRLIVTLVFLLIIGVWWRLSVSGSFFSDYGGGPLRLSMIREGLTLLTDAPLSGYGVEMSVSQFFEKIPNGYIRYFPFSPHLGFLQMVIESGFIATIFFFLPFYFVFRTYFIRIKNIFIKYPITNSAIFGLAGILIYYLLHPINGRVEYVYIGLLLGAATYNKVAMGQARN